MQFVTDSYLMLCCNAEGGKCLWPLPLSQKIVIMAHLLEDLFDSHTKELLDNTWRLGFVCLCMSIWIC